jgi:hypothetical protein
LSAIARSLDQNAAQLRDQKATVGDDKVRQAIKVKEEAAINVADAIKASRIPVPVAGKSAPTSFSPQALAATVPAPKPKQAAPEQQNDQSSLFEQYCGVGKHVLPLDGNSRIDYLGIKDLLTNLVARQDDALYHGTPAITLDTLTLTSQFEVIAEAQAGTLHFFRIVPLLVPPNTEFKLDHTHFLKVELHGAKAKGDPSYSDKLISSCKARIQRDTHAGRVDDCATVPAMLLETIAEKLESQTAASQ